MLYYATKEDRCVKKIDKYRFIPSVTMILLILTIVSFNLNKVQSAVDKTYYALSHQCSWLFIGANIAAFIFSIWVAFGKYKDIKLGGASAKPEYGTFSWISMMFTTSCSAGLIVFGFVETIIYASAPPFEIEPFSLKAYEQAMAYTHYHWGINAWSLYVPASIAIGYMLYNRGETTVSMSAACKSVLKKNNNGVLGCIIDVIGTFGAVVAPVTSMGLGMPLLTILIQEIWGIGDEYTTVIQAAILIIWIAIFGTSVYLGLGKGIKNLSNVNVVFAFSFMAIVGIFLVGPFEILKSEVNTLGNYTADFVRMITYTDPYGDGDFVGGWTVWYWAWLIVYMPLMGVFNARISKGRTLKQIALGQMVFCSLGCWVAMMTLGNYSIKLQQNGINIASILNNEGQPAAILAIVKTMPAPRFVMVSVAVLCFIFMATTVDSSSFVTAETTIKHNSSDEHAPRIIRIFWAGITCIITFILLQVGGFNAVQMLALLVGLPLAILMFVVIISTYKMLKQDC